MTRMSDIFLKEIGAEANAKDEMVILLKLNPYLSSTSQSHTSQINKILELLTFRPSDPLFTNKT